MKRRFIKIEERLSAFQKGLIGKSYDILFNFFLIMFSLFATEAIQRLMDDFIGVGILVIESAGFFLGVWRIISVIIAAVTICIFFIHGCIEVIELSFDNKLIRNYIKVFYILYLSLAPWVSLHIARLVASIFIANIQDKRADYIFIAAYLLGLIAIKVFLKIITTKRTRRHMHQPE